MLDTLLLTTLVIVWAFEFFFFFLPLGNERSMVRRLPLVTIGILAAHTLVYFLSLPITVQQDRDRDRAFKQIKLFVEDNRDILVDEKIREELKAFGLFSKEIARVEEQIQKRSEDDYKSWLMSATATQLRRDLQPLLDDYATADQAHLYNRYGLERDGNWKVYQLVTYSFLHANSRVFGLIFPLHLFFNLIALFAVGYSVEDLWGRNVFLLFYLLSAVAASIPDAISGTGIIGASGSVSAVMGAFLVRLPRTRIKVGWFSLPLALPMLAFGKKPYGVTKVASSYYLAFFFLNQTLLWWFFNYKMGSGDGVSYRCHLAGVGFGVAFALVMKVARLEERYINPRIEAKISFYLMPRIANALEHLDRDEMEEAEKKLRTLLSSYPGNAEILMALVQVYERAKNYAGVNESYAALIHHHLEKGDKEAALYAYDNLLLAFPDNRVEPHLPNKDWLAICEYLEEVEMPHEAAVEYERLVNCSPDDPLTPRACAQGGEAAMESEDYQLAKRLFEKISDDRFKDSYSARARLGLERCEWHLNRGTTGLLQSARLNSGLLNAGPLPRSTKPLPYSPDL